VTAATCPLHRMRADALQARAWPGHAMMHFNEHAIDE